MTAPRAEPHVPPPEAYLPPPRLDFGDATPIFEQRTLLLLVRNHSAVPTSYTIGAGKYQAGELSAELADPPSFESFSLSAAMAAAMKAAEVAAKRAAAARERAPARPAKRRQSRKQSANTTTLSHGALRRSAAGTGAVPARRGSLTGTMSMSSTTARSMSLCGGGVGDNIDAPCRPILGDAHEHSQPFFSANGVNFSAQRLLQQREAALLSSGAGACIELTPSAGELPPWGEALIAVRSPCPPPPVHVAHFSRPRGRCARTPTYGACTRTSSRATWTGCRPLHFPSGSASSVRASSLRESLCKFSLLFGAGSPIVLDDSVVGLSMRSPTPSLVWPPSAVGDRPSQKTLRVANKARDRARCARDRREIARDRRGMHCLLIHASPVSTWQGPRDAEVTWSLHAPPDATCPVEATVQAGAEGRLRLKVPPLPFLRRKRDPLSTSSK